MTIRIDEFTAGIAAGWWAGWMMGAPAEDKTAAFALELKRRLMEGEIDARDDFGESVRLYCDYDPQGTLIGALRAAGAECRGFMWSAQQVGFPTKTGMRIHADGHIEIKEGYGAPYVELRPAREAQP